MLYKCVVRERGFHHNLLRLLDKFTLQWFASAPADEPVLRGGDVSEDVSDDNLSVSQSDGADAILRTSNTHTHTV